MSAKRGRIRAGVLGGTFDPIHLGHLAAAQDAADQLALGRVLVVPNRLPPHKQGEKVSAVEDREAMVQLAIADNPLFELSRVELDRPGPSYTLDTLRQLSRELPTGVELFFLAGSDVLTELQTWHQPQMLLDEFRFVFMDRPTAPDIDWSSIERHFPQIQEQVEVAHVLRLEISGNDLRRRVREGKSIRYYVPPQVERYIQEHALYKEEQ